MLKRIAFFLGFLSLTIVAIALGVYAYLDARKAARVEFWESTRAQASQMVRAGQAAEALELLNTHFNPSKAGQAQRTWPPLMVQAALESHAYPQLESLVAKYPGVLLENESAALWWMRAQMHLESPEPAEQLSLQWPEEKRTLSSRWHLLEADALIRSGQTERALESLQSWQGEGDQEVNRQLRIALLAGNDESATLDALNSAFEAQPRSAELRAISAEFLERMGAVAQARRNYVAAFLLQPENPLYGHLLADFYLRSFALPQAIETWRDSYEKSGDPRAWWQVWFWERVTRPRNVRLEPTVGQWWGALPVRLAQTADDAFLSTEILQDYPRAPAILADSEAYHWLWSLELIRQKDEAAALETLRTMPVARGVIAPELYAAIIALLEWRVEGDWPRGLAFGAGPRHHRFLRFLETYRPTGPPDSSERQSRMDKFLASDYAVGSLLMANGWLAAADRLLPGAIPQSLIKDEAALDWLAFADTRTQAALHGNAAGLERSGAYPGDPAVAGLAGELLLVEGRIEAGLARLDLHVETPGPTGYRAAYLSALAALEQGNWQRFDNIFARRPDLDETVSGRELRARAALGQEDADEALAIYKALGSESVEGSVYRYRVARAAGDFEEARALLDILIGLAPNEPIFRQWSNELDAQDG